MAIGKPLPYGHGSEKFGALSVHSEACLVEACELSRTRRKTSRQPTRRFFKEREPLKKEQAGRDMIRAIFGKDSIAEDPIL
jgi:hypothetical protein